MERIKEKYDDLTQKARPGSAWVSGFTLPGNNDDLRAIDSEGAEMRFIPASRYYASCKIKRGQAVSIAQLDDLTDEQKQNKYAYIKITDPDIDDTCLGIAMNYAEEGQIVQIQKIGKFNYYTTNSILYTEERKEKEIFLDADGWNFDNVRGQKLFIKKLYNNTTKAEQKDNIIRKDIEIDEFGNSFDTAHRDKNNSADTTDWFTYDFIDSIYNTKNTIQVGFLTDAPTTQKNNFIRKEDKWYQQIQNSSGEIEDILIKKDVAIVEKNSENKIVLAEDIKISSTGITLKAGEIPPKANEAIWVCQVDEDKFAAVDDLVVTIELDISGDTRGPIDNTQFIVTLGESIYFESKKQDVELTIPHFNEGIFDEIKVLSIAQNEATGPSFKIFNAVRTSSEETLLDHTFIALRRLDGDTYIIPVLCNFTKEDLDNGNIVDVNDEGYYKLSKQFTKGVKRTYIQNGEEIVRSPQIVVAEPILELNRENLIEAISKGLQNIFVDDETNIVGCETTTENIGDDGFFIKTDRVGGYYDIYFSTALFGILSVTQIEHGHSAEAGTAMLADIRDADRSHIIGVVLSNQNGHHKKGETVKVIKTGRITTLGNLKPGTQYFLGLNGRITARQNYWYDECVPIGIAESTNTLIVDVSQTALQAYGGTFPIGYMKPSVYGKAETGFALADGTTIYSKEQYPELYNLLLNWFTEDELKPSNVNEATYDKYKIGSLSQIFEDLFVKSAELEDRLAKIEFSNEALKDVSILKDKVDTLNTSFESFKNFKDKKDEDQDTLIKDAEESEDINVLKEELLTSNKNIDELSTENTNLKNQVADLEFRLEDLYRVVRELAEKVSSDSGN